MLHDYYDGANWRLAWRVPPTARRVLDVGCGTGRLGDMLKAQYPGLTVWGLEKVPEAARQAAERLDRVIVADLDTLPKLPCSRSRFDCILCGDVLEHLPEPEAALRYLRTYLAPAGLLLCSVPNVSHWSVVAGLLRGEFTYEASGLLDRTHLRFFTPASFRAVLEAAGYQVEDEEAFELPNPSALAVLSSAAERLGMSRTTAEKSLSVYQQIFVARNAPARTSAHPKEKRPPASVRPPTNAACSVVILTYNSMAVLPQCLGSLLPTLGPEDEVILVDNASTDGTGAHLRRLEGLDSRLHMQYNDRNLGYSAGCNVGLRAARHECVVTLNPDTILRPGWLHGLQRHFQHENVGAVGPLSNYIAGAQFAGHHLPEGALPTSSFAELPAYLQACYPGQAIEAKFLIGFCLLLRRSLLEQVGYLDESLFLGSDDLELSWRLRLHGYRLLIARDVFVEHKGNASFQTLPSEETQRLLAESTRAFAHKLETRYGRGNVPSSRELFGIDIFPLPEE